MNETKRTQAIIELLAERTTAAEIASAFEVDEREVLLWKTLYLDGAAAAVAPRRKRGDRRMSASFVALGTVLASTVGFVGYARSQTSCAQTLPSPLVTFCAGTPASASQVNGNFQQLVDWLQGKVGAVGTAGVTTSTVTATSVTSSGAVSAASVTSSGSVSASQVSAARMSPGGVTPTYASWSSQGTGDGGAAIYNDASSFKTLMIVGNSSAGGPRRVGLWDNVTVSGNLSVNANGWDSAGYTGGSASSLSSEPTGDGWGRGRQACNNVQAYSCPNGQYVCGIEFWHGCGWSWYDEVTRVRCCSL